jgi:hypothetical protein
MWISGFKRRRMLALDCVPFLQPRRLSELVSLPVPASSSVQRSSKGGLPVSGV